MARLSDYEMDTIENVLFDFFGWDDPLWDGSNQVTWMDGHEIGPQDATRVENELDAELGPYLQFKMDPYDASLEITKR